MKSWVQKYGGYRRVAAFKKQDSVKENAKPRDSVSLGKSDKKVITISFKVAAMIGGAAKVEPLRSSLPFHFSLIITVRCWVGNALAIAAEIVLLPA